MIYRAFQVAFDQDSHTETSFSSCENVHPAQAKISSLKRLQFYCVPPTILILTALAPPLSHPELFVFSADPSRSPQSAGRGLELHRVRISPELNPETSTSLSMSRELQISVGSSFCTATPRSPKHVHRFFCAACTVKWLARETLFTPKLIFIT